MTPIAIRLKGIFRIEEASAASPFVTYPTGRPVRVEMIAMTATMLRKMRKEIFLSQQGLGGKQASWNSEKSTCQCSFVWQNHADVTTFLPGY